MCLQGIITLGHVQYDITQAEGLGVRPIDMRQSVAILINEVAV